MTEHMRGPWHADMELIESDEGLVATAYGRFGAEIEANSHLIAAGPDLLAALEDMLDFCAGMDGPSYGGFMGGDPRRFTPDKDACTPEEVERWRAACKEWDEGRGVDRGPGCDWNGDGANRTGEGFGMGSTNIVVEEFEAARRAIAKARGELP